MSIIKHFPVSSTLTNCFDENIFGKIFIFRLIQAGLNQKVGTLVINLGLGSQTHKGWPQKIEKKWIFDKSWGGRGSQNILSKIEALYFVWFITLSIPLYPRSTLFCMIYYSVCTPDPQKVIGIIDNVNFKA